MRLLTFFLIKAFCTEQHELPEKELQYTAMTRLLQGFPTWNSELVIHVPRTESQISSVLVLMGVIKGSLDVNDVCRWKGVTCVDCRVVSIHWVQLHSVYLNVQWLPTFLIAVKIQGQTDGVLKTRLLPRQLDSLHLVLCNLACTVDFTKLPSVLKRMDLSQNSLRGVVNLCELPATLQNMNLTSNQFSSILVMNENLPSSLEEVVFRQPYHKIRVKCLDAPKYDNRVKIQ